MSPLQKQPSQTPTGRGGDPDGETETEGDLDQKGKSLKNFN